MHAVAGHPEVDALVSSEKIGLIVVTLPPIPDVTWDVSEVEAITATEKILADLAARTGATVIWIMDAVDAQKNWPVGPDVASELVISKAKHLASDGIHEAKAIDILHRAGKGKLADTIRVHREPRTHSVNGYAVSDSRLGLATIAEPLDRVAAAKLRTRMQRATSARRSQ